jgi:hypothetical protein
MSLYTMVAFAAVHHKTSLINIEDPLKLFITDDDIVVGDSKTQLDQVILPIVKPTFGVKKSGPLTLLSSALLTLLQQSLVAVILSRRFNDQTGSHSKVCKVNAGKFPFIPGVNGENPNSSHCHFTLDCSFVDIHSKLSIYQLTNFAC